MIQTSALIKSWLNTMFLLEGLTTCSYHRSVLKPSPWRRIKLNFKNLYKRVTYRDHFLLDPTTFSYHRSVLKSSLEEEETIIISRETRGQFCAGLFSHCSGVKQAQRRREKPHLHIISSHELEVRVYSRAGPNNLQLSPFGSQIQLGGGGNSFYHLLLLISLPKHYLLFKTLSIVTRINTAFNFCRVDNEATSPAWRVGKTTILIQFLCNKGCFRGPLSIFLKLLIAR